MVHVVNSGDNVLLGRSAATFEPVVGRENDEAAEKNMLIYNKVVSVYNVGLGGQ